MKVRFTLLVLLLCSVAFPSFSQIYAVANGNWDTSTTSGNDIWSLDPAAVTGTIGLRPSATDDVFTNGFSVNVPGNVSCKNLFVEFDVANSITFDNNLRRITVTGTLLAWDSDNGWEEYPVADVISSVGQLIFTGANLDNYAPYVIYAWDPTVSDFGQLTFTLGAGNTFNLFSPITVTNRTTVSSGTLQADNGAYIEGQGAVTLTVAGGATLNAYGLVSVSTINVNGSLTSADAITGITTLSVSGTGSINATNSISASNLTVTGSITASSSISANGTLTINSGGQINTSGTILAQNATLSGSLSTSNAFNVTGTLNLNSGATLTTSYTGGTQGWWSGTSSPSTLSVDPASTVVFSSNSAQNLYTQDYGNLVLSGSGTKTVTGGGTLNVKGNLTIGSPFNSDGAGTINIGGNLAKNQTWSPADVVTFNGTGAQQISGSVLPTFNGGLQVNKAGGTLSLLRSIEITSALTVSQGTFDASNQTITLNGNLSMASGTLSFGTGASLGTLVISGTTSVSGAVPSFGNLTVNAGASFTSAGTVNIAGDVSNNGTFNVNGIILNGTTHQDISGTLTLTTLTAQTGTDVSNLGTINMSTTGIVTLEGTASFNAGSGGTNTLRLRSTSLANGARIAPLPNPNLFSGNVTVERYINAPEDWRYMSIPVVGGNVGMIKDDMAVTGNFSDPSPVGGNVVNSSSPSIYYLSGGNWVEVGSGGSTASTSLSNTRGYTVWSYLSSGVSLDVDGEIGKGPVSVAITGGDNLLPNPYPSAVDWDLINLGSANLVTNAVYLRTANGQYASYVQGGPSAGHPSLGTSWAGQIATGQAFWVVANGSGSITFQEDDKVASTNFVREAQPENFLRLRLRKDEVSDDVVIHFREGATLDKDQQFDALKKSNDIALNISTYNTDPSVDFAINGVPLIGCEFAAKVKLGSTNPVGEYALAFEDLSSMNLGYDMILVDHFLNQQVTIAEGVDYNFSITDSPASKGANRFEIVFKTPVVDRSRELAMESFMDCDATTAKVSIQNSQPGISYQFLMDGAVLTEPVTGNGDAVALYIPKNTLAFGFNSLNLRATAQNGCDSHEFNEAFSLRYDEIPQASIVSSSAACNEGTVTLSAGGAPDDGFYRWYEALDSVEPIGGATTSEFTTPVISKTKTYFVSAVNATGCEGARVAVTAEVHQLQAPELSVQGNIFSVAEGLGDYQWYLNGEPVSGGNSNSLDVKKNGSYSVTVSKNGCTVSSTSMEFLVNGNEHKALSDYYDLYPNPVGDQLTITGPDLAGSIITVYDRAGQQLDVTGQFDVNSDGEPVFLADFSHIRNGVYLLNIQNHSKLIQLKVIKR